MERIIERLEAARASAVREQHFWIAAHAIDYGLYTVPAERRAEFDPLGMLGRGEEIAVHLTDDELAEAFEAGYDDYWEIANSEHHEAYDATEGYISGLDAALTIVREEADA